MFLSIPNIAQFSFLQKKTYAYCEGRIFSSSRANNFWNCVFAYPQYWKIFICAKKKNLEDKQTNNISHEIVLEKRVYYKKKRNTVGWYAT